MVDYGMVALLVLQLFMVAGCAAAYFRIQGQLPLLSHRLDNLDRLIKAQDERLAAAASGMEAASKIPAGVKVRQDEQASEIAALSRLVDKVDAKTHSLAGRLAAAKRWDKENPQDGEGESDYEEPSQPQNQISGRQFGRRRAS